MSQSQSHAPSPWAEVRGVSHIALEVSDLARSIAFYKTALGLEIFHDSRVDGGRPNIKGLVGDFAIELEQNMAPKDRLPSGDGLAAAACAQIPSFTVTDVEAAFASFFSAGFAVSEAILQIRGTRMFFAKDPDGHVLELIEFPLGIRTLADLAPTFRTAHARAT
jgi:glyoxylase I family protein